MTTYDVKLANDVEGPAEGWSVTSFVAHLQPLVLYTFLRKFGILSCT